MLHVRRFSSFCLKNATAFNKWWYKDEQLARLVMDELLLEKNFITSEEETSLVTELDSYLRKHQYQKDHWDYAITNYRETERKTWKAVNRPIIERLQEFTVKTEFPAPVNLPVDQVVLPHIHVLDLAEDGEIKPHVDSVRYCGGSVVVVSLLSDAMLRLAVAPPEEIVALPVDQPALQKIVLPPVGSYVDVHIPRRSVYVMRGGTRYLLTHAVLSNSETANLREQTQCDLYKLHRTRRLSVICRTQPRVELINVNQTSSPRQTLDLNGIE